MQRRQLLKRAPAWGAMLAGGLAGVASAPALAQEGRIVRLGQSAALTGTQSRHGRDIRAGVAAALAAANRQEAMNKGHGLQFELVTLDDGGLRARSLDNTRQLIDGGAMALVGFTSGSAAEACLPLVERHQLALIGTASGTMGLRANAAAGAVHVRAGYDVEYKRIVAYIKSYGFKRVGHVFPQDSSPANLAAMNDALESAELKPALAVGIDRDAASVTSVVHKLLAERIDGVMFTTSAGPALAIIEQMKRAGYHGMFFASSLAGQDLIDGVAAAGRSVVMSLVVPRPTALGPGGVSQCRHDLQALAGSSGAPGPAPTLGATTLEGYIAGRVAVEAVRQAARGGAPSRQRVREALATLHTDLGGYRLNYAASDRQGSQYVDLVVVDRYGRIAG